MIAPGAPGRTITKATAIVARGAHNRADDTEPVKGQGVTANLQVLDNPAGQQL